MQLKDLSKPITSLVLNENLARKFGYKLNLEQFNDIQLEDVRNKLRTELSQLEVNESFDNLHMNAKYQKTRALLDVINQEIMERESGKCPDCHHNPCECEDEDDHEHKHDKHHTNESIYYNIFRNKASRFALPESWVESAVNRMQLGESDQEELAAELTLRYDLSESQANHIVYLAEGESDKAEIIMATKDMVDRITGWLEDVAAMKAEQLLELLDSIRETQGSDVAQSYQEAVKPALEAIYTALETSRQGLSNALSIVSGGEPATIGSEPSAGSPMPGEEPGGDEALGGSLTSTPPALETGREKRESIDYSRKLGLLLSSSISKKK
jgi:hypothetical protein